MKQLATRSALISKHKAHSFGGVPLRRAVTKPLKINKKKEWHRRTERSPYIITPLITTTKTGLNTGICMDGTFHKLATKETGR